MATIERLRLENDGSARPRWDAIAERLRAWADTRDLALRDAIVLLPYAQLLPLARQACARLGGWQPRVETTRSLAAALGPATALEAGQLSFDPVVDELQAARLLRSQSWGAAWSRSDARGFAQAAAAVTRSTQALATAAHALPPQARDEYWARARAAMLPPAGPGRMEWQLARVALEWASAAPTPASDRLFGVSASAWIAVQAGGVDPLVEALMADADRPCAVLDTDPPAEDPYAALSPSCAPVFALCDDFEHEAQCAAAQVIEHVRAGELPVALIAQDRVLVRRVRALLERERVALSDETGWKLSTTRAAAQVMSLLVAARAQAGTDALLDWLKSGTQWSRPGADTILAQLEADCRRAQIGRVAALAQSEQLQASSLRLAARAVEILAPLAEAPRQALGSWLAALQGALDAAGVLPLLEADDAGRQVLAQLRRAGPASDVMLDADAFRDWVDRTLEQASFVPSVGPATAPQVVITPLARAVLRPFAALVLPGADDRRLGAQSSGDALIGDTLAGELGLPTSASRRAAETCAFVHALAAPRVTLMRRRLEGSEPLADSPLVERLRLALQVRDGALGAWCDPRIDRALAPTPIAMSAPSAPDLLPGRLSASAFEALRACPYQFYALRMLRLTEDEELEREVEKRDYGQWLHAVLYDFHAARAAPPSPDEHAAEREIAQLHQIAQARRIASGLADAEFLPFAASFASFAPRYIAWLHARDAQGVHWRDGETRIVALPPELEGSEMYGVIDRIDDRADGSVELIDYKTGNVDKLREKINSARQEDTQLAFYAALMRTQTAVPLSASYLAVDRTRGIKAVPHPQVDESAALLVAGLAHDLARLRGGAGMRALGEGETCEYCAARGVCRRDHWSGS